MSRVAVLIKSPKKTLTALAAVTVAVAVTVGSGATFTSSSANGANTFSGGILSQTNSLGSGAILTASNMIPGGSAATGTVTITNTGNVPGTFTLTESALTHSDGANGGDISTDLDLVVTDTTGGGSTVKYTGKLNALTSVSLGIFAAASAHTYTFAVTLPQGGPPASLTTGDNLYQGSSTSATFNWTATT